MVNISGLKRTVGLITLLALVTLGALPVAAADFIIGEGNASTFISKVYESEKPFTGLAATWNQHQPIDTEAVLHVKVKENGDWTGWVELHADHDHQHELEHHHDHGGEQTGFLSTNLATAYQYKVELSSANPGELPSITNLEFETLHEKEEPQTLYASVEEIDSDFSASTDVATSQNGIRIISRNEWGADESVRLYKGEEEVPPTIQVDEDYRNQFKDEMRISRTVKANSRGQLLTWPIEYSEKVSKIVVHHTASTKDLDNPEQAIRNIYSWHALTRGWGDIGYNYLIDQQGNIYEGRYGGEGVVGAHAGPANIGSIGIAVLGNYQENQVPEPVVKSLAALIGDKTAIHGIDPTGSSMFRGEMMPNVFGHRDVMSTACPGDELYDQIRAISVLAKEELTAEILDKRRVKDTAFDFALDGIVTVQKINANENGVVELPLKNVGTRAWNAETFMIVLDSADAQTYFPRGAEARISNKLGKTVNPGETATFRIALRAGENAGFANLEIFPKINGTEHVEKYVKTPVQVISTHHDYELVSVQVPQKSMRPGQRMDVTIKLRNIGANAWPGTGNSRIVLGTEKPRDRVSRITLKAGTRLGEVTESSVEPGEVGTFVVKVKAPRTEGYYREHFAPLIEGVEWLPNKGHYIDFYVSDSAYRAQLTETALRHNVLPGQQMTVNLEMLNIGRNTWAQSGVNKVDFNITKSAALAVNSVNLQENEVLPGQSGNVQLTFTAPQKEGLHRLLLSPAIGDNKLTIRPIVLIVNVKKVTSSGFESGSEASVPVTSGNNIRIGLGFQGDPFISATGGFTLYENGKHVSSFAANDLVEVGYDQGQYRVKNNKQAFVLSGAPVFAPTDNAILRIDNYENRPAWNDSYNDNEYRGNLEVHWHENRLHIVNELDLEDYLRGLAEIDAKENFEKIKAIIVLARSYAKFYMTQAEKFPGAPFHLTDDPQRSQFYLGHSFEKRNTTGKKAVNETASEVVTYNGTVIKTPYFSSSDGRTRSAQEVWGWTDTPYLISVDDPGCAGNEVRGHGVGLSGCGAQYWAEKGLNYHEIIKYYFQGVKIERR